MDQMDQIFPFKLTISCFRVYLKRWADLYFRRVCNRQQGSNPVVCFHSYNQCGNSIVYRRSPGSKSRIYDRMHNPWLNTRTGIVTDCRMWISICTGVSGLGQDGQEIQEVREGHEDRVDHEEV